MALNVGNGTNPCIDGRWKSRNVAQRGCHEGQSQKRFAGARREPITHSQADDAAVDHPDQVWQILDLDNPACPVGHAVLVAADHESVMADPSLKPQHGVGEALRQQLQLLLLFGNPSATTR